MDSLLVLTGVTGLAELVEAGRHERPSYIGSTLAALARSHPLPERSRTGWVLGGWEARVPDRRLEVHGAGDPDDWWRVVAEAAWEHLDTAGNGVDPSGLQVPR